MPSDSGASAIERIYATLRAAGVRMTPLEIARVTGINPSTVKTSLRRLLDAGRIEQPAPGIYSAIPGAEAAKDSEVNLTVPIPEDDSGLETVVIDSYDLKMGRLKKRLLGQRVETSFLTDVEEGESNVFVRLRGRTQQCVVAVLLDEPRLVSELYAQCRLPNGFYLASFGKAVSCIMLQEIGPGTIAYADALGAAVETVRTPVEGAELLIHAVVTEGPFTP